MVIVEITLDELLEKEEIDIRTYNCLKRAKINTLNELTQVIDNEGIPYLCKIRNLGRKSAERLLYVLAQYKYNITSMLDTYIEQLRNKNEEWISLENIKNDIIKSFNDENRNIEPILLRSLNDMPVSLITRLWHFNNIKTIDELLSQFKNEEIESIGFNAQIKLLRVLDSNGYRFAECSKEIWGDIEDYIMVKRAKHIDVSELEFPNEIKSKLNNNGVTIFLLITNDLSFLQDFFTNIEIIILLQQLDAHNFRIKDCNKEEWEDINDFIRYNLTVTLDEINLSQYVINILNARGIFTLLELSLYSRQGLESIGIGTIIINKIVNVLYGINFYLQGEEISICDKCNNKFLTTKNDCKEHYCNDCTEKIKRVNKISDYEVSIENPDYGSYTNGKSGFTLLITIHNKSKKVITVKIKEFTIFSNNRQWSPSYSLTGYSFDNEEYIIPQSSKTLGKIWCEDYWQDQRIIVGDYVIFTIIIKNKTYCWKFIMNKNQFELDDYYVY